MFQPPPIWQTPSPTGQQPEGNTFPPLPAYPLMIGFAPPTLSMYGQAPLDMVSPLGARIRPVWARSEDQPGERQAPQEMRDVLDPGSG